MHIPNSRQFHIHADSISENVITIKIGELYKQMTSVLRLHKGDAVRFFDGAGNVYEGQIALIGKNGIVIPISDQFLQPRGKDITLAIGILKNDRMRWVLEKATELGVWSIVPILTERVVKRPSAVPPRWHTIVKEAAEQSGRAWIPHIEQVQSFEKMLKGRNNTIVCDVDTTDSISEVNINEPITVVIGPEGGFTEQEILHAKSLGAKVITLGDYQLRADTAAITALARL